jgi:hypothetical protein
MKKPRYAGTLLLAATLTTLSACSGRLSPGAGPGEPNPPGGGQPQPQPQPTPPPQPSGTPVAVALQADQQAEVDRLTALLAESKDLTAAELLRRRAVPFRATLGYDPQAAVNLNLVQASALRLDAAEMGALAKNGFVISDKRRYPHFAYGYETIYSQDLPVFVSADSILQAVHQSYDAILKAIELEILIPKLGELLTSMRGQLASASALDATTRADADLFLTLGLSLLSGKAVAPVAGARASAVNSLLNLANASTGSEKLMLFGLARQIDFSQFKPRGHYAGNPALEQYFRAMMWLGRIDFPFLHTNEETGKPELIRRSVAAALALRSLMDAGAMERWKLIDGVVRAFVGEPDSMAPPEVDRLQADLGLTGPELGTLSDEKLAAAIVAGAYGRQKILSQIVLQERHDGETWPLDATFLFFGQRYVFDSHVLSNVVYDRWSLPLTEAPMRMMPNTLDAAFAALGNDQAAQLVGDELRTYKYAPALESMRRLGDEHGATFWDANLYNLWVGALRALSPGPEIGQADSGLPPVAQTEAWGRRLLNTQLASWAQLRHDTILYAKQSYTSGVACEFPDAYVDPYPAFFGKIEKFAAAGLGIATALPPSTSMLPTRLQTYFQRLGQVSAILREMAQSQRTGMPHKPEHVAFINQAVQLARGCGGPAGIQSGWYAELFFNRVEAAAFDPTIADVHTQPTDEVGTPVGRVLHVGTGYARLMVMTAATCMGPRAYAGVVSSYHEQVTEKLQRLNDAEWARQFTPERSPADVPWMADLIVK